MIFLRPADEVAFWVVKFFASMIAGMLTALALVSVVRGSLARDIGVALTMGLLLTVKPSWRRTRSLPRELLAAAGFGVVYFLIAWFFEYTGWPPRRL